MPTDSRKTSMKGFADPSVSVKPSALASLQLEGKRLVIIGGTDGLGRALANKAASRGAQVTVVGRTFRDAGVPGLSFVKADLSLMKEAARLGKELPVESTDILVFTTGIIAAKSRELTAEGLERDMAISYLNRLVALRGLAPRLGTARASGAPKPRVFVMGFPGAGNLGDLDDLTGERSYDAMKVHMNTVAGNEALVLDGKQRYPAVLFFGLNPGLIKTNIRANFMGEGSVTHRVVEFFIGLFMQSPDAYAERIVPLLFAPELEGRSAVMFGAKANAILPTEGMDAARAAALISASEKTVAAVVPLDA
jgi:NAD(P)-dependent dehydrogenase (short-subunit alcohol dehydrogenase family)